MKKFIIATIVGLFTTVSVYASDFYSNEIGYWYIYGNSGNADQNPACVIEMNWQDGSTFQLIKDLKDGEVYIWFQNMEWNISDEIDQNYDMRINFTGNDGSVVGAMFSYYLANKNTIVLRNIEPESFVDAFVAKNEMQMIMPGTIENAYVGLDNSTKAIEMLIECIDTNEQNPILRGNSI